MREVFKRALHIEMDNYTSDYKGCLRQAIGELVPQNEIVETCLIFDINFNEYIDDLCKRYLEFKYQLLTGYCK